MIWHVVKGGAGAVLRGLLAGFVFWIVGQLLINIGAMPSGDIPLAIVAWMIGANVLLASRVREVFDRPQLPGVPRQEQRSEFVFQLLVAGAAALLLGLFFEAIVYGLMEFFGIANPYFCILAFGISFGSFWIAYVATGGSEPETQT